MESAPAASSGLWPDGRLLVLSTICVPMADMASVGRVAIAQAFHAAMAARDETSLRRSVAEASRHLARAKDDHVNGDLSARGTWVASLATAAASVMLGRFRQAEDVLDTAQLFDVEGERIADLDLWRRQELAGLAMYRNDLATATTLLRAVAEEWRQRGQPEPELDTLATSLSAGVWDFAVERATALLMSREVRGCAAALGSVDDAAALEWWQRQPPLSPVEEEALAILESFGERVLPPDGLRLARGIHRPAFVKTATIQLGLARARRGEDIATVATEDPGIWVGRLGELAEASLPRPVPAAGVALQLQRVTDSARTLAAELTKSPAAASHERGPIDWVLQGLAAALPYGDAIDVLTRDVLPLASAAKSDPSILLASFRHFDDKEPWRVAADVLDARSALRLDPEVDRAQYLDAVARGRSGPAAALRAAADHWTLTTAQAADLLAAGGTSKETAARALAEVTGWEVAIRWLRDACDEDTFSATLRSLSGSRARDMVRGLGPKRTAVVDTLRILGASDEDIRAVLLDGGIDERTVGKLVRRSSPDPQQVEPPSAVAASPETAGANDLRLVVGAAIEAEVSLAELSEIADTRLTVACLVVWNHALDRLAQSNPVAADMEQRICAAALRLVHQDAAVSSGVAARVTDLQASLLPYQNSGPDTVLHRLVRASWRAAADGRAAFTLLSTPTATSPHAAAWINATLAVLRAAAAEPHLRDLLLDAAENVPSDPGPGHVGVPRMDPLGRVAAGTAPRKISRQEAMRLMDGYVEPADQYFVVPHGTHSELAVIKKV